MSVCDYCGKPDGVLRQVPIPVAFSESYCDRVECVERSLLAAFTTMCEGLVRFAEKPRLRQETLDYIDSWLMSVSYLEQKHPRDPYYGGGLRKLWNQCVVDHPILGEIMEQRS